MRTSAAVLGIALVLTACSGAAEEQARELAAEEAARQAQAQAEELARREMAAAETAAIEQEARARAEAEAAAAAAIPAGTAHVPVEISSDERAGGDTPWIGYAGEGFRYQVPPGFTAAAHPVAGQAWTGTRSSMMGETPVAVTFYAMRAPFTGDLAAWEAAETARVTGAGGQVESMDAIIFGPNGGPAKQLTITEGDRRRTVRGAVRDGFLYTATCEADRAQFLGVMADCAIAVSGLHFHP